MPRNYLNKVNPNKMPKFRKKKKCLGTMRKNSQKGFWKGLTKGPWIGSCILRKVSCRYWGEGLFSHSCWRAYSCLSDHYRGNMLMLNVFPYAWAIDNPLESVRNPHVPEGGKRSHRVPGSLPTPAWACSRWRKLNEHKGTVVSEGKNAAWVSPPDKASLQLHLLLLLFSSLPLLRWLLALLLLERPIFLWPGKGAIAGVHEVP